MRTIPAGLDRKEAELYSQLDPGQFPKHVAIIMDGNGRWAKRRHLPRIAGHRKGVESVRDVIQTASRIGLPAVTLYAFSAENFLRRPPTEISFLMKLLHRYLKDDLQLMQDNNVRLSFIGRSHLLPQIVQERMAWAKEQTSHNTGMIMTLALNYGSRSEIVDACKAMVTAAANNGGMEPEPSHSPARNSMPRPWPSGATMTRWMRRSVTPGFALSPGSQVFASRRGASILRMKSSPLPP